MGLTRQRALHADVLEVQVGAAPRQELQAHHLAAAAGSVGAVDFVVALLPVRVALRADLPLREIVPRRLDQQLVVLEAVRAQTC